MATQDAPKVERRTPHLLLTVVEMRKLLEKAAQPSGTIGLRNYAILSLLFSAWLPVKILASLNIQDIQGSCIRYKDAEERIVSLDPRALAALKRYLAVSRPALLRTHEEEPALFVTHYQTRLTQQKYWRMLNGYAKRVGITHPVTPKTLALSFAIRMLTASPKKVSAMPT